MLDRDRYYCILRHGNTKKDVLQKSIYKKYAHKIAEYIHSTCIKYNLEPIFLCSPIERCDETLQIVLKFYNKMYKTEFNYAKTLQLYRSGKEENSKAKLDRIYRFMHYVNNTYTKKHLVISVTHSSYIPRLCQVLAGISKEYFAEKHEVYLNEGALAIIKENDKIIKYNVHFDK